MKIQEIIGTLLAGSTRLGTYTLPELMQLAQSKEINGIAVAVTGDREFDLVIMGGEPEGAILIEEKGALYGDKAVMLLTGTEKFELYDVKPDLVEAVVLGCRILEKGHIRKSGMDIIPEIGKKSDGLGVLSIAVQRSGEPQNGVRVSIRKEGQMICNDITTQNGTVGFKLLFGKYDCVVQDRSMMIHTFHIIFDPGHTRITLEI
ncbi:MAG: hypothetical protein LUQ19_02135 [Methanoregula sp.]|nr:hypothetical protein [Methanoregula sp.]